MITGETKTKIDDVWQKMWEGGITNPIEVISQLTYLMFMRSLDGKEYEIEQMETLVGEKQNHIFPEHYTNAAGIEIAGDQLRWSRFKDLPATQMHKVVSEFAFPFIKSVGDGTSFSKSMESATFGIPSAKTLEKAVTGIDELFESYIQRTDDLGDLYEYMLSKLSTAGTNGQFRTPKHIRAMMVKLLDPKPQQLICDPACGTAGFLISAAEHIRENNGQFRTPKHIRAMMVKLLDPKPQQLICDPACGTAGFLISAAEHIRENHGAEMTAEDWACYSGENGTSQFTGFEMDQTMLRISAMNLMLHGAEMSDVRYMDSLSKNNAVKDKFDLILANPPFTGSVDVEDINPDLKAIVDSKQTELLFVSLFLRMLKRGGRCACIVPNGVLFRTNSKAYTQLRRELVESQKLEAVIFMPSGVFKPYSGVSTAILVFTKTDSGGTDKVWLYNMEGDGFTLDDKRDPDEKHDDVPDILARWANLAGEEERVRTEKSFLVTREELAENDYDFSFNKYTETVYERIEYPPTEQILAELADLNKQIAEGLEELSKMLGRSL